MNLMAKLALMSVVQPDEWSAEIGADVSHTSNDVELFAIVTASSSLNNVVDSNALVGELGLKMKF